MDRFLLISGGFVALTLCAPSVVSSEMRKGGVSALLEDKVHQSFWGEWGQAGWLHTMTGAISKSSGETAEISDQVYMEPRRLEGLPSSAICNMAETSSKIRVQVDEYTLQAKFKCGQENSGNNNVLVPAISGDHSDKCFGVETCPDPVTGQLISATLEGIKGVVQPDSGNTKTFTVTLEKMPNRDKKLYFKCNDPTGQKSCVVTVEMPTDPGATTCTPDKAISLEITEKTKEVHFVCQDEKGALDPEEIAQVYEGGCAGKKTQLDSVLKGSILGKGTTGTYTLSVPALPEKEVTLCYKCAYTKNQQAPPPANGLVSARKACEVTIKVAGRSPGGPTGEGATTTTTQATNNSSSFSYAASLFHSGSIVVTVIAIGVFH